VLHRILLRSLLVSVLSAAWLSTQAATLTFTGRAAFAAATAGAPSVLDDYDASGYHTGEIQSGAHVDTFSDAGFSNVVHEVAYTMTGGGDEHWSIDTTAGGLNNEGRFYRPESSTLLDFRFTTVGTNSGVYGVGFDHFDSPIPAHSPESLWLLISFGDATFANYLISGGTDAARFFFGITSDRLIKSIHIGGFGGTADPLMATGFDNLLFGGAPASVPVPLPAAAWLMLSGLAGTGVFARRRRTLQPSNRTP
jgi:hypothetical protein